MLVLIREPETQKAQHHQELELPIPHHDILYRVHYLD